jgi:hypothetical protein
VIALLVAVALGHPTSPSLLRLVEGSDGVELVFKTPDVRTGSGPIVPALPTCRETTPRGVLHRDGALEVRARLDCERLDEVGVEGLDVGAVIVEVVRDGGTTRGLLVPEAPRWRVPAMPSRGVLDLVGLGAAHLLGGADHVLLVVGLVLLVRGRGLVHAITAFTLGHAASLALATAGLVSLPTRAVEAAIAATLVLLASEAAADEPGPFARRPWRIGVPVGLVHGLGFAGGLGAIGVGREGILVGVLGFNLGLEVAQLAIAGAALLALPWLARARRPLAWGMGAVAGMWLVERAVGP